MSGGVGISLAAPGQFSGSVAPDVAGWPWA